MNAQQASNIKIAKGAEITKLETMRVKRNLSQADLANLTGLSLRRIQAYEQRNRPIDSSRLSALLDICVALKCNLDDIMGKFFAQEAARQNKKSEMLYLGRMDSFNRFYPKTTTPELPKHWADDFCKNLPERELSEAEKRADAIRYRITSTGIPFSQAKVPAEERVS